MSSLTVTSAAAELRAESIFRELVRLAWPIAVSVLSYSLMTFVDTYFVAQLGAAEVGGVGLGGLAAFTTLCFAFGLLRSVKVLVSQETGAGRPESVRAYLGAGILLASGLGVACSLLALPVAYVLPRLAPTAAVGQIAQSYLLIRAVGTLPVLLGSALREARYGIGDSRLPMYGALLSNLLHIPLNYLLIFELGWGIEGAAWSTVCAQCLELSWLVAVQYRAGFGLALARARQLYDLLRIGFSTGLEFFLGVSAFTVLVALIARMSEADLAAHQIGIQLIHFAFLPVVAIGEAGSVLAGQVVGANRDRLVKVVALRALWLAMAYAGGCALLFGFAPELLLSGFSRDPAVHRIGLELLWIAAGFQLFDAVNIVLRAVLRGTGDVRVPAMQAVISSWLFAPALTWWFGIHHGLGAAGGWLALTIDMVFGAGFVAVRMWRGSWRSAALAARARMLVKLEVSPSLSG
jgi:MATE family multidrug resistance protein